MRIGFDAKRAFHNFTGLGNYSRTLIHDLSKYYPENEYIVFNTKQNKEVSFSSLQVKEVRPQQYLHQKLSSLWRSKWMVQDILDQKIAVFHGLSHEIPYGIEKTNVKTIVSIHDLIFELYPEQYNRLDVALYRKKYRFACKNADRIIAISAQTKADIVELYQIDPDKITVCYQSCDPIYFNKIEEETQKMVQNKYQLPTEFVFYVGSIIERKNLLAVCKAMQQLDFPLPLVIVGQGSGSYRKEIQSYIEQHQLGQKVIFLTDLYGKITDLAAIYSLASLFVYASIYEGFGIPVLEALSVGVPVITSNISCLPEAGGSAAYYVNPFDIDDIAAKISSALNNRNTEAHQQRIIQGKIHAQSFSNFNCAQSVMEVYQAVMQRVEKGIV